MKKKQIIGLSTLLLVLLLGSFTISYANSYRDFTETEFKNVLYKAWINFGHSETDVVNSISTHENNGNITTIVNNLNNTNNCIISFDTGSTGYNSCYVACYNSSSNTHPYFYDGRIFFKNRPSGTLYKIFYNGSFQTNTLISYSYESRTDYIYYGDTFYNSSSGTTVTHAANTYTPSTFFDEWYYQNALPFSFIPKPADEYADVYYFEDIPLYNASGEDLYLGQLFSPTGSNTVYWTKDNYYYRYNDWNLRQLPLDSIYLQYFTTDENGSWYDVYLQSKYIYENTIYSSVWADGSTEPYTLAICNFYIKNNYTSVVNGVVNPNNTFSGDYKDKYDNELDNQEDVNNISQAINDTINQPVDVSGELGAVFSGDIYDIAGSMGFDSTVSIYFTFIEDFLKNVCSVLVDDNDVYFDYNMHGETPTRIYSSDIGLPDGHPLKIFISIILVFLTVYLLYFQFMKLFETLQTADLSNAIKSQDISFYIFKM